MTPSMPSHVLCPPRPWFARYMKSWMYAIATAELATELEWSPVGSLKRSHGIGPTQPITFPLVAISGAPML